MKKEKLQKLIRDHKVQVGTVVLISKEGIVASQMGMILEWIHEGGLVRIQPLNGDPCRGYRSGDLVVEVVKKKNFGETDRKNAKQARNSKKN